MTLKYTKILNNTFLRHKHLLFSAFIVFFSCSKKEEVLFTKMNFSKTGIDFNNKLDETEELNVLTYEYMYNGGGVAAGDLNLDGLTDLYFSGNLVTNRLYINKGNFEFEDQSEASQVEGKDGWKTGVSMADVNGDGWLDIYVCYSGPGSREVRANQLFINNGGAKGGIPTFSENAEEFGIDAPGTYSTQGAFFDYDLDGDLDLFLLNHAVSFTTASFNSRSLRKDRHPDFGNRLYRNENNHFVDVSTEAGIYGSILNYGLSVSISDFNNDHYPDLYVSNDYEEQDFFYLNNGNGTFKECLKKSFGHISKNTMGSDVADFNNDLRPDLITLDMLPEDNRRQKLLKGPDNYDRYKLSVDSGYHFQQMRNMLQLNQGWDSTSIPIFSEIGQLAGVSNTDWSWTPLFADFDNDGLKDLLITNGFVRDFTNLDFQKYGFEEARAKARKDGKELYTKEGNIGQSSLLYETINSIPITKISNYIFKNSGDLTFENQTENWGLKDLVVSTGAVYADLDNDGDLDIVINNTNDPASIYKNNENKFDKNNYIKIKLIGEGKNTSGIGSKVYVKTSNRNQFIEAYPIRGYQSTVENVIHFGIGKNKFIEEIKVVWPDGRMSLLEKTQANKSIVVKQKNALRIPPNPVVLNKSKLFKDISAQQVLNFEHHENGFIDFKYERLLLYQLSKQGPRISKADVNADGEEDIFIGGASGQSGQLFLRSVKGIYIPAPLQPWTFDKESEDAGSLFFDVDGDGDQDLYVVSGGSEFPLGAPQLTDRLYFNDGKGNFKKGKGQEIPVDFLSGSSVVAADYDQDGDLDLYVGGCVVPAFYPIPSPSKILRNDTDKVSKLVRFTDVTEQVCPGLKQIGVVNDALWEDVNQDGWPDLLIVGDWMPITVFRNDRGVFKNITNEAGLRNTGGFWTRIKADDFDGDGDQDFVLGNIGLNTELRASEKEPLSMYLSDFDQDGRVDPLICNYMQGVSYPIATRDDLIGQVNSFKKKFVRYADYADATIDNVLDQKQMEDSKKLYISFLQSCYLENEGQGKFNLKSLPLQAQFSPCYGIVCGDFNGDKKEDVLLTGNLFPYRVQYGPCDAGIGVLLSGDGKGNFNVVPQEQSGLIVQGDVRDMVLVKTKTGISQIIVTKNNDFVQVLRLK